MQQLRSGICEAGPESWGIEVKGHWLPPPQLIVERLSKDVACWGVQSGPGKEIATDIWIKSILHIDLWKGTQLNVGWQRNITSLWPATRRRLGWSGQEQLVRARATAPPCVSLWPLPCPLRVKGGGRTRCCMHRTIQTGRMQERKGTFWNNGGVLQTHQPVVPRPSQTEKKLSPRKTCSETLWSGHSLERF